MHVAIGPSGERGFSLRSPFQHLADFGTHGENAEAVLGLCTSHKHLVHFPIDILRRDAVQLRVGEAEVHIRDQVVAFVFGCVELGPVLPGREQRARSRDGPPTFVNVSRSGETGASPAPSSSMRFG